MSGFESFSGLNVAVILVVILVILTVIFMVRLNLNQKKDQRSSRANAYVKGLNEFIACNYEKARGLFKEAALFDSNNVDAYVKLGMIYRIQKNAAQALKIHEELTFRTGLDRTQLIDIYSNIVMDLADLGKCDEALAYCDKILDLDVKNDWAHEFQPRLYEKKKDFKNAYKYLKSWGEKNSDTNHRLVLYKIAHGRQLMERGQFHDARILFKEGIKLDKTYPPGYLYLGDAYAREERRDDAVKVWREFAENVPQKSYLVFAYLDTAFFESGNYDAMEGFYTRILEKDPDNYHALLNLGEIYFKKGDREKAFDLTERGLKINPRSPQGLKNLILYLDSSSDVHVIKDKALSLTEMMTDSASYQCAYCDYTTREILIQCPSCEKWDAFSF